MPGAQAKKSKSQGKQKAATSQEASVKSPNEAANVPVKTEASSPEADSGVFSTTDESDLKIVEEVLKKLSLDCPEFNNEQKLNALCLIFKQTVSENVKVKESLANVKEQLEKREQTNEALQKLCQALQLQIKLKAEEGELKVKEETQKRVELAQTFQNTIDELGALMATHSDTNTKLKEENSLLSEQMKQLIDSFENQHKRMENLSQENKLQAELYEARMSKAKLERAEMTADFTKERLELQKSLLEAKDNLDLLLKREENYQEQIELYKEQWKQMQTQGTGPKDFVVFRDQIDKLTQRLKQMEQDTCDWKHKFEASSDLVKKMNQQSMEKETEVQLLKKKLQAMQDLNRTLHKERQHLLSSTKDKEPQPQPPPADDDDGDSDKTSEAAVSSPQ